MTGYRSLLAMLPLVFCSLTGCGTMGLAPLPVLGPLPEGFSVRNVAKADAGTPFAVNRSGEFAVTFEGALQLIPPGGIGREIAKGTATALCFSPSGERLAAAFPAGAGSTLRLLDREGKLIAQATLPERVTSLVWRSEGQLLASALDIKKFSFGSELISRLYTWDGTGVPVGTTMNDVTVRPNLARLPDETLLGTLNLALSPFGDEIAYSTLIDPPVFVPYLKIAVRHLESGNEKEVTKTSPGSGGPLFTPDGESLVVGDTHAMTRRLSIPDGKEMYAWPAAGTYPALSRSGSYLFLDGRLYLDGSPIASFPTKSRASFLPDGSGLAIGYNGALFLVSGLRDQAAAPPADLERLLKLRRLRSLGLITEKEYRAQKGKASLR
jgi:WD40 repeat protein